MLTSLRCRRRSVRKPWKSTFSITPLLFDAPCDGTPAVIPINLILPETRVIRLHLCCWQYGSIFIQIFVVGSVNACILKQSAKWPFKFIQGTNPFGINRKRVCNFLFVINSNLAPFTHITGFLLTTLTPPLFYPNFGDVPLGLDCPRCGSEERRR